MQKLLLSNTYVRIVVNSKRNMYNVSINNIDEHDQG